MKTLLEKEIRLIFPAFALALVLAIAPLVFLKLFHAPEGALIVLGPFCLFGVLILAVCSFGREFSLKTLSFNFAQPVARGTIWWTKIGVLAVCITLFCIAALGSLSLVRGLSSHPDVADTAKAFGVVAEVVVALVVGGVWLTLLLRQMTGAFWLAVFFPAAIWAGLYTLDAADWMILAALGLYAVAAFFLAWRQFLQLQDTAWSGTNFDLVHLPAITRGATLRERRPWAALLGKELHLQQATFLGVACLLVLSVVVVLIRRHGTLEFNWTERTMSFALGVLWFAVPFIAGALSIAEERSFGTMQGILCLPFSRAAQWTIKVALLCGISLVSAASFALVTPFDDSAPFRVLFLTFFIVALLGFYGSTLTTSVVQALGAAVFIWLGIWSGIALVDCIMPVLSGSLIFWIGIPVLAATLLYLSWRNFASLVPSVGLWRRNLLVLLVMLVVTCAVISVVQLYRPAT